MAVVWRQAATSDEAIARLTSDAGRTRHATWTQRGRWMLLAFVPSSLMLGVTSYLATDVASVPLLWVVPLALYLITFVLAFSSGAKRRARSRRALSRFSSCRSSSSR